MSSTLKMPSLAHIRVANQWDSNMSDPVTDFVQYVSNNIATVP
jgi:hypothetical protein